MSKKEILTNHGLALWMKDNPVIAAQIFECMDIYVGEIAPLPTPSPKDQPEGQDMPDDVKTHLDNKMRPYHNRLSYRAGALDLWEYLQTPETPSPASEAGMSQEDFEEKLNEPDIVDCGLCNSKWDLNNEKYCPGCGSSISKRHGSQATPTQQGEVPEEIMEWMEWNTRGLGDHSKELVLFAMKVMYHKMQQEIKEYRKALQNFVDKVDRGEARSKRSYAEMKDILAKYPQGKEGGK